MLSASTSERGGIVGRRILKYNIPIYLIFYVMCINFFNINCLHTKCMSYYNVLNFVKNVTKGQ